MPNSIVKLYQVQTPYFVAGFEAVGDKIVRAAPIIKWIESYSFSNFEKYCKRNKIVLYEVIQKEG